ncbi:heavy-metal-associated domain-containing protein [Streptomyces anthocyanicus]|uniref:heavy-metal-associated domain-containing protein n=1 Tax=Streptomyces anthocyanicus TaxID=68174 RepID=UPI002F910BA2|nr:heavy-metal-associated domain-containing protein [Streptomyces anthocyanicus]
MTCGHCKDRLTKQIGAQAVDVGLDTGQVSITTAGEPDDALLAKFVDDADYELTGRAAQAGRGGRRRGQETSVEAITCRVPRG